MVIFDFVDFYMLQGLSVHYLGENEIKLLRLIEGRKPKPTKRCGYVALENVGGRGFVSEDVGRRDPLLYLPLVAEISIGSNIMRRSSSLCPTQRREM